MRKTKNILTKNKIKNRKILFFIFVISFSFYILNNFYTRKFFSSIFFIQKLRR